MPRSLSARWGRPDATRGARGATAGVARAASPPPADAAREARQARWLLVLLAVGFALWAWPLVVGERTLFLRDVFVTHLPYKAFGAAELAHGRIPAVNPSWGLGQSFRGNPNALPFYPGNLLYLALPFWSAFNLHYLLHWLLAFVGMRALARALGLGAVAAIVAALAWAGSGYVVSLLTFYNLLAVAAWWPLVLWGALAEDRRGLAAGGLACGMALLGGEPLTAALGLVPLLLLAGERHGWRRGFGRAAAIGTLGSLVALPQLVATARVFAYTSRHAFGLAAGAAERFALTPWRLLELVLPLPFGWPGRFDRLGIWSQVALPLTPYVFSLSLGVVGLALALAGAPRRPRWAALAAAGLLGAWLAGGPLAAVSGGLFRFPEKLLIWWALAAALLAGIGCDTLREGGRRWRGATAAAALALLVVAAIAAWRFGPAAAWLGARMDPGRPPGSAETQTALAIAGLAWGGLLLLAAVAAVARQRLVFLVPLQAAALVPLLALVPTDDVAAYAAPPPWQALLSPGAAVVPALYLPQEPPPAFAVAAATAQRVARLEAANLAPAPGVLHGLGYPLAPDLEGLATPPAALLPPLLARLDWPGRIAWLRLLGVEGLVESRPTVEPPLPRLATAQRLGATSRLYAIPEPAPLAFWPRRLEVASDPAEIVARLARAESPQALAVVDRARPHDGAGEVRVRAVAPDRLELEVTSAGGGLVVVRRAFQPFYNARAGTSAVETMPVDLALLGVAVPAGAQRVVIEVAAWPEAVAGALALLVAGVLAVGLRRRG